MRTRRRAAFAAAAVIAIAGCSSGSAERPADSDDAPVSETENREFSGPGGVVDDARDAVDDVNQRERDLDELNEDFYGE